MGLDTSATSLLDAPKLICRRKAGVSTSHPICCSFLSVPVSHPCPSGRWERSQMTAFSLLCHHFSLDAGYQLLAFVGLRSAFPDSHPLVAVSACRAFPSLCSFSPGGPSSSGRMRGSCGANLCFSYCFIASPGLPAGESHL